MRPVVGLLRTIWIGKWQQQFGRVVYRQSIDPA
jgi:hypothetical protein